MIKKNIIILTAIGCITLVSACSQRVPVCQTGMEAQCDNLRQHYVNRLNQLGVKVADFGNKVEVIVPGDDLFAADSSQFINKQAQKKLIEAALLLKTYPRASIKVIGHTDDVQSPSLNQKLSYQQAKQVAGYLWTLGVPMEDQKLHFFGRGQKNPIAGGKYVYGQMQNRRIEIWVNRNCGKCSD